MADKDIHAVSVVAVENGRFLLVRRGRAPALGLFAFPGGRVGADEDDEAAARRELVEETALTASSMAPLREIVIDGDDKRYRLKVYRAYQVHGTLRAGDDADHAGWYTIEEMRRMPITASTLSLAEEFATGAIT